MTAFDPVSESRVLPDDVSQEVQTVIRPGHAPSSDDEVGLPPWYVFRPYQFGRSPMHLRP